MRDWRTGLKRTICDIVGDVYEYEQRRALIDRPWEEEFLHWVRIGDGWQLHGRLLPPNRRCRCPTSGGWCLGRRDDARPPSDDAPRR